jgi:hypothetical protein
MPIVRTSRKGEGEAEGEGIAGGPVGVSGDLWRQVNNQTLAEHAGRFIAGQVVTQYQNEDLADMLKGKNMIMVSGSWG